MKTTIGIMLFAMSLQAQTVEADAARKAMRSEPRRTNDIIFGGPGAIAHVVDGDGLKTTITMVNLENVLASFTLSFYADNGAPMILDTNYGRYAGLTGTIPARGTITIATPGLKSSLSQGWGKLDTTNAIGGTVLFQRVGDPGYEAGEPIDTMLQSQWTLPFDHTNGNTTGVAIVNPFNYTSINVFVVFRDENGNQTVVDSFTLSAMQHVGIVLSQLYPQTVGRRGTVQFSTSALWLNVIGLHFAPSGAFSTVTPLFWF